MMVLVAFTSACVIKSHSVILYIYINMQRITSISRKGTQVYLHVTGLLQQQVRAGMMTVRASIFLVTVLFLVTQM